MTVSINITDNQSGIIYDVSSAVADIRYETNMYDQPGRLTLTIPDLDSIRFHEGSVVRFNLEGVKIFSGYLFTIDKSSDHKSVCTCYDKVRYLGSRDAVVFENTTLKKVAARVSKLSGQDIVVVSGGTANIPKMVFDGSSYYEMLQWAMRETLRVSKKMYVLRDEYGVLRIRDVSKLMTDLVLSDGSLITGWDYQQSIDKSYTVVKLVRDRTKNKKVNRALYTKTDIEAKKKWGQLQYYEKVEDKLTDTKLKKLAGSLLDLYSKNTRTLRLSAVGYPGLRAGDGVYVSLSDLQSEGLAKIRATYCSAVTHNITGSGHTMDLEVQIP